MRLFLVLLIAFSLKTLANDGFYQGAGATLVPIHNDQLNVITENLEITAFQKPTCYKLLLNGNEIVKGVDPQKSGTLSFGKSMDCKSKKTGNALFETKFHAKAVYHVRALDDAKNVQMGFPVPEWTYEWEGTDGLNGAQSPGVVNFKTFLDGKEIQDLQTKEIEMKIDLWGNAPKDGKPAKIPAYIWHADFKKGKEYDLITEYDFGYDISNGFYPPRIPEGRPLWWDKRTIPEGYDCIGCVGGAISAIYFLHPIKLWATPAPKEISVRFEAPPTVPVTYLVTATKGLDCVDRKALYFRWKNELPESDLFISYPPLDVPLMPQRFSRYKTIKTDAEFVAWISLLGDASVGHKTDNFIGKIRLSCDLIDEIKNSLNKSSLLFSWTKNGVLKCVQSCE